MFLFNLSINLFDYGLFNKFFLGVYLFMKEIILTTDLRVRATGMLDGVRQEWHHVAQDI